MSSASALKLKKKAADFEAKKQLDKALSLYIQLLEESGKELDDGDLQLYNRVGDLLMRQGNVTEALGWYERAVDVYAERGFLNNAIALCNKILRQSPARSAVYYKLGRISASKGFKSDAKKNFLEYADRMQKAGQTDEAFRALKEFADLCPDQDDIRLMLADWLTKENRKGEAVEQLETLYSKLESEGRAAEARATMDRIKAIDPNIVPRPSGAWVAQKSSDLVFLDLADEAPPPRRNTAPVSAIPEGRSATPPAPQVPALAGLTLAWDPNEDDGTTPSAPIEGLLVSTAIADGEGTAPVEGFVATEMPGAHQSTPHTGEPAVVDQAVVDQAGESNDADGDFSEIDLDAILATPPATPELELHAELPLAAAVDGGLIEGLIDGFAGSQEVEAQALVPEVDLLRVMETPIGMPVVGLVSPESIATLDLLDLNDVGVLSTDRVGARDTSELVAIDGSARSTDELLIIEPESLEDATIPTLDGPITPDAWVEAALGARDEHAFDHLLTPLAVPGIELVPEAAVERSVELALEPSIDLSSQPPLAAVDDVSSSMREPPADDAALAREEAAEFDEYGVILRVQGEQPVEPTSGGDGIAAQHAPAVDAAREESSLEAFFASASEERDGTDPLDAMTAPFMREDRLADSAEGVPGDGAAGGDAATHQDADDAEAPQASELPLESERESECECESERGSELGDAEAATDVVGDAFTSGEVERALEASLVDASASVGQTAPPVDHDAPLAAHEASALDTSTLCAALDAPEEEALIEAAFRENRIELPLLDVAGEGEDEDSPPSTTGDYATFNPGLLADSADFLAAPPSFETPENFQALPPLSPETLFPEEWPNDVAPEVLIDGEWRDEHVGDLVSGEMTAIPNGPTPPTRFDDLSAALMWPGDGVNGDGDHDAATSPGDPRLLQHRTPFSPLSFGGVEAQLRRRLELDPRNWALHRQLGEELLGVGDRDGGLAELESALVGFEQSGDLEEARKVADIVLRVVPASVRHHQKRVEYAVRSGDRPRLVEAYVELADALFRSGDPDKAHVVYTRVLDLSPGNQRARLALGLVAPDEGFVPPPPSASAGGVEALNRAFATEAPTAAVASRTAEMPCVVDGPLPALAADGVAADGVAAEGVASEGDASIVDAADVTGAVVAASDEIASDEGRDVIDVEVAHGDALATAVADDAENGDISSPASSVPVEADGPALADGGPTPMERALASLPVVAGTASESPARLETPWSTPPRVAARVAAATPVVAPVVESPRPVPPPPSAGTHEETFDLGDWLRASEPVRSTRMVTSDLLPSGDEQKDFDDMLRRFKQGLAENVDEEDFDSHYDLGVAFKEMGLTDEAIAEFQKALRGEHHRVRAYEALGQCFVEKGQMQVTATLLRRAVESTGADDQQLVGVLYLLGFANESMERHGDALGYYQRVFAVDIEFRDVAKRVAAMEHYPQ